MATSFNKIKEKNKKHSLYETIFGNSARDPYVLHYETIFWMFLMERNIFIKITNLK